MTDQRRLRADRRAMEFPAENIGERVAALRKALGLRQTDLAEAMRQLGNRWHPQTVDQVEHGSRGLGWSEIQHLAWYFAVPVSELVGSLDGLDVKLPRGAAKIDRPWTRRTKAESRAEVNGRIREEQLSQREKYPGPT